MCVEFVLKGWLGLKIKYSCIVFIVEEEIKLFRSVCQVHRASDVKDETGQQIKTHTQCKGFLQKILRYQFKQLEKKCKRNTIGNDAI